MATEKGRETPFSLYIHIPFCGQRCPYCDFNTYVEAQIPETEYTEALLREVAQRSELPAWKGRPMQSIFFGGGTPSLFSAESIGRVIASAQQIFPSPPEIEISIEANPGTVSERSFCELRAAGVKRISLGAQTFNRSALRQLGRAHSVDDTINAFAQARSAGIPNINLDLIYALPEQSLTDFEQDLQTITDLHPEHISAYQLTIEKGTPFSFRYQQGDLKLPPEDDSIAMMALLERFLGERGFLQYEISNFARQDYHCRHNQAYWDGDDYLGLGAGAHSYSSREGRGSGRRWSNFALPREYMQQTFKSGTAESWSDTLSSDALKFEFFFLGLRRIAGVSISAFREKFTGELIEEYHQALTTLTAQGLLVMQGDLIFLSERGRLLSDSVFEHFISSES